MDFLKSLSVFLNTIIGAGIFALPFVASKAGFLPAVFYFLAMAFLVWLVHYIYGEVVLGTEKQYRFPGYLEEYLGRGWRNFSLFIFVFGFIGSMLVYLILGGEFLSQLLSPYFGLSPLFYSGIFFGVGALLIFFGIKSIAKLDLFLLVLLLLILLFYLVKALPHININYFQTFDPKFIFLPYGVVLFSLWGVSAIPELEEMLILEAGRKRTSFILKKTIFWGVLLSALVYLLFVIAILGITGPGTSKEALSGFGKIMGSGVVNFGFIFGIIAVFTSFLTLGVVFKKMLWHDFKVPENIAWLVACFTPFLLFLFGLRQFIGIIGILGALGIGAEGTLIVVLYRAFLFKKYSRKINPFYYLLILVFLFGVALELGYSLGY